MKRLSVSIVLVILMLSTFLYVNQPSRHIMDENATVRIIETEKGYEIIRNGRPFYIKGAGGKPYFKELSEAGGNTLRLYDTINTAKILDEALKYDIAVILDIPLPDYNRYAWAYEDNSKIELMKTRIRDYVMEHKDHPALLMWNLGNELMFPFNFGNNEFIDAFNVMVDQIHKIDSNHPVGTTVAGASRTQVLSIHFNTSLDIISYNMFGNLRDLHRNQTQLNLVTNPLPYYISEWGIHGPWEYKKNSLWNKIYEPTSVEKAELYKEQYLSYIDADRKGVGSIAFYWGDKYEGTPTWFNIIDEEGRKSNVYYALKEVWSGEKSEEDAPYITKFLLNEKVDSDLQLYNPKDTLDAELKLEGFSSKYTFKWEVLKEGVGFGTSSKHEINLLVKDTIPINKMSKIQFQAPEEEGAYRLMAYVYDDHKNFATANIPFFVLKKD
ncbi:glycoside hydrolase family 2 TIM barrel-domain containing protein [Mangrovimonas sp. TPBH4]|uniref:glycoside hydrolase family 2 TIM barrel-domain containing protein n=1 Tax=Mangrovimonas sp. TPBH4 TaxID=1645914 RepID=UPI0006B5276E|nr:glycoside hydrolase family 2 TIM barrel-domain containing protein [Mangrovimonas sp. TPBH4]